MTPLQAHVLLLALAFLVGLAVVFVMVRLVKAAKHPSITITTKRREYPRLLMRSENLGIEVLQIRRAQDSSEKALVRTFLTLNHPEASLNRHNVRHLERVMNELVKLGCFGIRRIV